MKKTAVVGALALVTSVVVAPAALANPSPMWSVSPMQAQDQKTECTASDQLRYSANIAGDFEVRKKPINKQGVEMVAQEDGLHIQLSGAAKDAEVVHFTTLGALIDKGPGVQSSGAFVNVWFDTSGDGQFFDLKGNTGVMKNLGGDDYAALAGDKLKDLGGDLNLEGLTLAEAAQTEPLSRSTKVAVAVGTESGSVVVSKVGGLNTVSCTESTPPTSTPPTTTPPTSTPPPTTPPTSEEPEPSETQEPAPEDPASEAFVDLDCKDFPLADGRTAQDILNQFPGDPHGLDADEDRIACEPGQDTAPDSSSDFEDDDEVVSNEKVAVPQGGVQTGVGPA